MSKDKSDRAFPRTGSFNAFGGESGGAKGMTLRDYFAAQSIAGVLNSPDTAMRDLTPSAIAAVAYALADAMLAERVK